MIALVTTPDSIKMSAMRALLAGEGIETQVFDSAAGTLWGTTIPMRLMVADDDEDAARRALRQAGFVAAHDGDWDLG